MLLLSHDMGGAEGGVGGSYVSSGEDMGVSAGNVSFKVIQTFDLILRRKSGL
jgi:hypothetical protein